MMKGWPRPIEKSEVCGCGSSFFFATQNNSPLKVLRECPYSFNFPGLKRQMEVD
jgi:hypothetical protein